MTVGRKHSRGDCVFLKRPPRSQEKAYFHNVGHLKGLVKILSEYDERGEFVCCSVLV